MRHHLQKKDIAEAQLNAAIRCYLVSDYIPAVTLAGAAEEIYGAYIQGKRRATRSSTKTALGLFVSFMRIKGSVEREGVLVSKANEIRNEFKHHGSENKERLRVNLKVAATVAIHRAVENYLRVGGITTPLIDRYRVAARNVG